MPDQPSKHAEQHTPWGPDSIRYHALHIALTGDRDDDDPVIVENNVWREVVHEDCAGLRLKRIDVILGTASSSGDVSVFIENETQAIDMLSSDASIASGDNYSEQSGVIAAYPDNLVELGDVWRIDITEAGTDAKGLKVRVIFW